MLCCMKIKSILLFVLICSTLTSFGQSQKKALKSGPMIGHVDFLEANIWIQAMGSGVAFMEYVDVESKVKYKTQEVKLEAANRNIAVLKADDVEPGKTYSFKIHVNGAVMKHQHEQTFSTPKIWKYRGDAPDFAIALGSCHYANQPEHDRPGKPYGDTLTDIFNRIADKKPNLMLWLGDNIYLREPDWNSRTGIVKRYEHMRSSAAIQRLLLQCPNYAIWDDHDFGPNDSDRSFWNKEQTLEAFKLFWANPSYGVMDSKGISTSFQYNDVDFFLLDNRYHRSPIYATHEKTPKTILGESQLQWIKDALLFSRNTFKIVAIGSQFLSTAKVFENYSNYEEERAELIRFIQENQIKNVIFITGDRHHSELSILPAENKPSIYDFTCSPLSSGSNNNAQKEINELRIPASLLTGNRNFGMIKFSGEYKSRSFEFQLYSKTGELLWNQKFMKQ